MSRNFFRDFTTRFLPLDWYQQLIRNPKTRILTIVISIAYLISPFDLIPEFIPILGWIDDGLLAGILLKELVSLIPRKPS